MGAGSRHLSKEDQMAARGAAERARPRESGANEPKGVVMISIEKQPDVPVARLSASGNRPSLTFILVTAVAIILIACALGWATFQSGASGWSPQDAAAVAASLAAP
jgi:hypothetical protein